MPVGALTAGISAVGTAAKVSASKKAAKAAKQAADASAALQRDIFNQSRDFLTPYVTRGNLAGSQMGAFLGLGGDADAARRAFDNYLASTGYQFQLGEGVRAITSQRATAGLLNSGSTLKALDKYSTGLAQSWTGAYLDELSRLAGQGESAAGSLSGAGQSYANAVTGINANQAAAAGAAAQNSAGAIGDFLGGLSGPINSLFRAGVNAHREQSSYGRSFDNTVNNNSIFAGTGWQQT